MGHAGLEPFLDAIRAVEAVGQTVALLRDTITAVKGEGSLAPGDMRLADRLAHLLLVEHLAVSYPDIPVISEEDSTSQSETRPAEYFLIDPIDGTSSWANGFAGYVSQLALVRGSEAVFGAMHSPRRNEIWFAGKGHGAYRNYEPLPTITPRGPGIPLIVVDNTPLPSGIIADLSSCIGPFGYLESGSLGLKALLVASGEADLFVKDVPVRDWDLAPAMVVLRETGAWIGRPGGEAFSLSGSFLKPDGVVVARQKDVGMNVAGWMKSRARQALR